MINKTIMFLLCKKLNIKKCQCFRFTNQKSSAVYYINNTNVMKIYRGRTTLSNVGINYLLSRKCHIMIATPKQIISAGKLRG